MNKRDQTPLEQANIELATYHGMLARWADLTGNVAPHDVDRVAHNRDRFREHLEKLNSKKKRGRK